MDSLNAQLDRIYDEMDTLMWAGRMEKIDKILEGIRVESTSIDLLVGYLTATLPVKSRLVARPKFFEAVKQELIRRGEDEPGLLTELE